MSEPRRFLFGSVPVYNPQSLSKGEAIAQFHAREGIYRTLLGLLREERPSHVLIIGTRGMGKTTLLQRVRFGVEDSNDLNARYLPLTFPEEQYNVSRLHHFLLNAVDALADALEQKGDRRAMEFVEGYSAGLNKATSEEVEEKVPKFLAEMSEKLQRGFLLLVDNADRLFETIEDREQWRLREMLSHRSDLTFFGATTQASEGIYGRERAFFEFFRIQRLAPLSLAEVRSLLLRLSEAVEKPGEPGATRRRVEEWLEADAGRLRTLVQLTGGNPRTSVLLFHLVLDGLEGGAREYLEQLLDQCTPNYKGRVDDLPTQAQQVLDALALRWDPATAMEIADDTGLETSAVSTQLTRLVRQGLLEKVDPGDSKKALYQVAERFFNIWYLMRASRRARTRLRWFVEFLRVFYDSGELEQIALERVDRFRRARRPGARDIENIAAYAFASGAGRKKVEAYLRRECADREAEWTQYFESPEHDELETGCLAALLRTIRLDPDDDEIWELVEDVRLEGPGALARSELAFRNVIDANPTSASRWSNLGQFLRLLPDREKEAEAALRKALELDPTHTRSLESLGVLLATVDGREQEAENFLRDAIELDPESGWTWGHLGDVLRWQPSRWKESEAALKKALELDPECQWVWATLGDLLSDVPGREQAAEEALRKALELDPGDDWSWQDLCILLGRLPDRQQEVEAILRAAIDLRPGYAWAWGRLGLLLWMVENRDPEAEAALRRAIEI
jgi:tetratricopeptide (TPR) repeat protein